jgi:hypothetical protein
MKYLGVVLLVVVVVVAAAVAVAVGNIPPESVESRLLRPSLDLVWFE